MKLSFEPAKAGSAWNGIIVGKLTGFRGSANHAVQNITVINGMPTKGAACIELVFS